METVILIFLSLHQLLAGYWGYHIGKRRWLPIKPFSCGSCLAFWFSLLGAAAYIYTLGYSLAGIDYIPEMYKDALWIKYPHGTAAVYIPAYPYITYAVLLSFCIYFFSKRNINVID
jgi:hypothetical protein